ncbi:calcium/sodium antiporter [Prosthecodimorpha staleyi]|uniref:Calcium/sodium antiporter n=1 Tax=Prosthecodimorpha staleyi TaxID=2840188 RepID=A0A947GBY5_9HYPH|nr:calcium/sodium antiporter [Prosthecodimorpha staleyi]MBT9288591.1 calcium/sodium antiporter [Prosthecodimorpha staleyi]
MLTYGALLAGLICAGLGGELFVRGTVGLSIAARIPPGIVAATIAAFATSSPELTVAIASALDGTPEISLGDALGSNVVNVALILALAILIAPLRVDRSVLKRDFPAALTVSVLIGALLYDGTLSRLDAAFLLLAFFAWLVAVLFEVRKARSAAPQVLGETKLGRAVVESAVGLGLLILAGRLIVYGATGIAATFGLSEFVIGATIVAIGTSVPELATAIISRLRGHDEVGLGTILGSNIFNGLFVVGVAAGIAPITVSPASAAIPLGLGMVSLALVFPPRSNMLDRWRGGLLVAVYLAYVLATLQAPAH